MNSTSHSNNRIARCIVLMVGLAVVGGSWLAACGLAEPVPTPSPTVDMDGSSWRVTQSDHILHIAYGRGTSFPEYAALHLDSSYFRLNYGPTSGWGTSIILLPVFWSKESCPPAGLCQGAPVSATWQVEGSDLALSIEGTIASLHVTLAVHLKLSAKNSIIAQITATVEGSVMLDVRPGEAFKPVMLSSMHVSSTQWDSQLARANDSIFPLPQSRWIIQPPVVAHSFSLQGGTSNWKKNAPSVEVVMDESRQVTGWVTQSNNPNDDNVGFWAASDKVLSSWNYVVKVSP